MKKTFTILIAVLTTISILAQDSEYKVFYFSGDPKIVDGRNETSLLRDSYISSKSVLKIPQNAYVVLMNKKDIPIGIKDPGQYSINDLNKLYSELGQTNITAEFFDYISKNILEEKDRVRRSGGVYRAVGDIVKDPFDEAVVISEEIKFEWRNPNQRPLYLKIYDIETWEQPYNIRITDSVYLLKLSDSKLQKNKKYAWTVYNGQDHPMQGTILRVFEFADEKWKNQFISSIREIEKGENPEINKIKIIREYMEYNIYPLPEF